MQTAQVYLLWLIIDAFANRNNECNYCNAFTPYRIDEVKHYSPGAMFFT